MQAIDLRCTVLAADGDMIFVPNSILFTDAITVTGGPAASATETSRI